MNKATSLTRPAAGDVSLIRVFVNQGNGGNPVPLTIDAHGMQVSEMLAVARSHGHESAFVFESNEPGCDWRFRFFVPEHEMEMCGHATVGTLWAMRQWGIWSGPTARIETLSGTVDARWDQDASRVWISQPPVTLASLSSSQQADVIRILGLAPGPFDIVNASTSRVKTLIGLPDEQTLNALAPDFSQIQALCDAIGSTGLYPYVITQAGPTGGAGASARQFPKKSGYPEDPATGIAAAALWGYLQHQGHLPEGARAFDEVCTVRQGEAMGSPSAILVKPRHDTYGKVDGCWLSGSVQWDRK